MYLQYACQLSKIREFEPTGGITDIRCLVILRQHIAMDSSFSIRSAMFIRKLPEYMLLLAACAPAALPTAQPQPEFAEPAADTPRPTSMHPGHQLPPHG